MTSRRGDVLLGALCLLGAALQLLATVGGLPATLVGGLACGLTLPLGLRLLQIEFDTFAILPLLAALSSLAGIATSLGTAPTRHALTILLLAPLIAAVPTGVAALRRLTRGARCQVCRTSIGKMLAFPCPRCRLTCCERCWSFERERCTVCETNQVLLLPHEPSWWTGQFGAQARTGRCILCLQQVNSRVSQWSCVACGHNQCRSCWDETNGVCSRCGWTIPDASSLMSGKSA